MRACLGKGGGGRRGKEMYDGWLGGWGQVVVCLSLAALRPSHCLKCLDNCTCYHTEKEVSR